VTIAWIGFDQPKKLGKHETGARAALPIWMGYMGESLKGVPEMGADPPEGVVTVKIDPATGMQSPETGQPEYFYRENMPPPPDTPVPVPNGGTRLIDRVRNQLF
jgi:penicillin-binding protein 1A